MKTARYFVLITLLALATYGCALSPLGGVASGGANYTYNRAADGSCQVTINSAREIAGANLTIGQDCSVTVTADTAGGNGQALQVIDKLVDMAK